MSLRKVKCWSRGRQSEGLERRYWQRTTNQKKAKGEGHDCWQGLACILSIAAGTPLLAALVVAHCPWSAPCFPRPALAVPGLGPSFRAQKLGAKTVTDLTASYSLKPQVIIGFLGQTIKGTLYKSDANDTLKASGRTMHSYTVRLEILLHHNATFGGT